MIRGDPSRAYRDRQSEGIHGEDRAVAPGRIRDRRKGIALSVPPVLKLRTRAPRAQTLTGYRTIPAPRATIATNMYCESSNIATSLFRFCTFVLAPQFLADTLAHPLELSRYLNHCPVIARRTSVLPSSISLMDAHSRLWGM
jgi:hypothetical protein